MTIRSIEKYAGYATLAAFVGLLVVPVLIAQFTGSETRRFDGVRLADTEYREVRFRNNEQDLDLGSMFFVPEGEGPFPAAVIIHGSGTSQRDSYWYLTLTQYLQNSGIAVLLPDKRGSEQSEGNWHTASFQDLATDTHAGIAFLRAQVEVAISDIGIIGMSQGGHIAPIVADQSSDVAFLVNVVGGSIPMHDLLLYEENNNLRQLGVLPGISNVLAYGTSLLVRTIGDGAFWHAVGNFDPMPYWERLTIRCLVLYGRNDTNVPTGESSARLRSLGRANIDVRIYEGSGHALEDPEGWPGEGDSVIFRKDALNDIADFIHSSSTFP